MKKKFLIVLIIFLALFLGIFFFVTRDGRRKDEDGNYTYICEAKFQNRKRETLHIYELKVNDKNEIVKFYTERKYFYHNDSDYWNALYSVGQRDVDFEGNKDDFTITIKSSNESLIDEEGNVIYPNYKEYMKQYIDENYQCYFEKKSF